MDLGRSVWTLLLRKKIGGGSGKTEKPLEAPNCGIATQAVYTGVISSFLYGALAWYLEGVL